MLVFVGTYTEPILFGTGKVLQGKGRGDLCLPFGSIVRWSGTRQQDDRHHQPVLPGVRCDAEVPVRRQRIEGVRRQADRNRQRVCRGPADGQARVPQQADSRTGPIPATSSWTKQRTYVFVANFMSGSVCVLPVRDDGSLGEASDFIQHQGSSVDPARQKGPHAHSVTLDAANRFAFVPDLGLDKLMVYRFDPKRGRLEANAVPWIKTKPGAGPRHISFHPGGRFAYLINELDSTMSALSYDGRAGTFEHLQTVPTLPEGFGGESSCADIQVSPSGASSMHRTGATTAS